MAAILFQFLMVLDKWFFNMVDTDPNKGHKKVSLTMNQKLQVLKI